MRMHWLKEGLTHEGDETTYMLHRLEPIVVQVGCPCFGLVFFQ